MARFFRRPLSRPKRRRGSARQSLAGTNYYRPLVAGWETLEDRALLSINLGFAQATIPVNGSSVDGYAVAADAAGNTYELSGDAVYKHDPSGKILWTAPYTASSFFGDKEGLAVDGSGNVYITGNFGNDANSPALFGTTVLQSVGSQDIYLAKLNNQGVFQWAESFGSSGWDEGSSIAVDGDGNAYVTGYFKGSVNFDAHGNHLLVDPGNSQDTFLLKVDTDGNYLWAKNYGTGATNSAGVSLAVDPLDNVYTTGYFGGTVDFDPAKPGAHKLTTFFNAAYILKLDGAGNFDWVEKLNGDTAYGSGQSEGDSITIDNLGNIYTTGQVGGPVNLDPSPDGTPDVITPNFVSEDAYIIKLGPTGNFVWGRDLQGTSGVNPHGIATDAFGNVYTTGGFNGSVDFDPGPNYVPLSTAGGEHIFVSALDNQGNYLWATATGEALGDRGYSIAISGNDTVNVVGTFSGTVNFNPGSGAPVNRTANGVWDSFLWSITQASISGTVWDDQNADGNHALNEPGVAGAVALLYKTTTDTIEGNFDDQLVATSITDGSGHYGFVGLTAGVNYYVQVRTPIGYTSFTAEQAATSNPDQDSDVSQANGRTALIKLTATESDVEDAGLLGAAPGFGMALGLKTIGFTSGNALTTDSQGNIYVAGSFNGIGTDFDQGPGRVLLSTAAVPNSFIAKYTAGGALVWVKQAASIVGNGASSIAVDGAGDVFVYGLFGGDTTFDNSSLSLPRGDSGKSAYLWKLDSQGTTQWAVNPVAGQVDVAGGLALDSLGNPHLTGGFSGTAAVGGTSLTDAGGSGDDVFVARFDTNGNPIWAASFGGAANDFGSGIAVDPSGNVGLTGVVSGSVSLSLGTGTGTLNGGAASTAFIIELDRSANLLFADAFSSTVDSDGRGIAIDSAGNLYGVGTFDGTASFGPDPTDTVVGTNATYVVKLNNDGSFGWVDGFATSLGVQGLGIAVDPQQNVYTTGAFAGVGDFNPSATATANLSATGSSSDIYISKLDANGNYVAAYRFGDVGQDQGNAIATDANGLIYATGEINAAGLGDATNFAPPGNSAFFVGAANEQDDFLLKLGNAPLPYTPNAAPSFTPGAAQVVDEDAAPQVVADWATNISAGPASEASQTLNFVVTTDNPSLFAVPPAIDPSNGTLTYTLNPDVDGVADVIVKLHDNGGTAFGGIDTSLPSTFTITANFVNDQPTFQPGNSQSVLEDSGQQSVFGWAKNISSGEGANEQTQTVHFNVSSDNPGLFSIQPTIDSSGNLFYTPAPNTSGVANVSITLQDSGGTANGGVDTSPMFMFPITVQFVNDQPSFTPGLSQSVNENSGAQTVVGWATNISPGEGANEANQTLTFITSTNNDALFATGGRPIIDPTTGTLTYTPASDVSGVAFVTVLLRDSGGTDKNGVNLSVPQTFTIAVNFVNDAPSFVVGANQTINEDSGEQVRPNFATNISPDQFYPNPAQNEGGQTVHFTLSTNNNALFSELPTIDPSGKLVYTPAANTSGAATVTVWLQDDGGTANGGIDTSAPQTFTITVNFVNDSPSFLKGPDQTIYVGAGPQTVPGWATSISPGAGANETGELGQPGQTVYFVVTDDTPGLFFAAPQIDASGNLTYTPQPGATGVAHVSVKLRDNGGTANGGVDTSPIQTFTVTILALNTPPTFTTGGNQEVLEDSLAQSVPWASNITPGTDPDDAGQTVHFNVSNDNSALFAVQPSIDNSGRLTYTPAPMMNGVATVTVQAQDNGGTIAGGVDTSAPITFKITVDFVNDSPSFTPGADQEVLENAGPQTVPAWATNISPGTGANEAGQKLTFTVTNDDNSLFSTQPSIDPATGTLTYTPAANQDGKANVTVKLADDGGTAHGGVDQLIETFQIKVDLVNSAPSFVKGPDQTVDEDAGAQTVANWATAISPGLDPSEAKQTLNFIVISDSNPGLFAPGDVPTIDPTTGTLSYTLAPNVNGSATLAIVLHDNGGTSVNGVSNLGADTSPAQVFTINALYVNDAPTFNAIGNQTVNENAGLQRVVNWATNLSPGPGANETWQTVHFNLTDSNPGLFLIPPTIDANGTLTYSPAPNVSGVAHLIATLGDNGGTANGGVDTSVPLPFDINVNFVNSAPSFAHGLDQTVNENAGPQVVPNWATQISPGQSAQEQGQSLNFTVTPIDATSAALFAGTPTINSSGTLTFRPALNASGTATLNVTLHDDGGTANGGVDTSPIETFHITINPVPALVAPITDQTVNENAADMLFNLAGIFDPSDPVTLSISNDHPEIVAAMLETSQLMLHFLADQFGVAHIDLKATDSQGKTLDDKFTVTVNLVNHAPSFVKGGDISVGDKVGPVTIPGWASKITPGPASEVHQSLGFQVVGNTNPALFAAQPAIDPATGNLTFTPQTGQFGSANISLTLKDDGGTANGGQDTSVVQTFKITVSATLVAMPDQYVLSTGPASSVPASQGVLSNDGSDDGAPLVAQLVQGPTHGTVTLNPDGSFSYAKGPSFRGIDQFSYQARDGQAVSNVVTVSIISYESTIVEKLYQQVLDRPADNTGLQYWTNQVQNGQPYGNIAQGIFESPERLDPIITNYYQQYLGRTPDAAGLNYWVNVWQQDGGPDDVVAGMISSPEFYHQSGGTNSGWLTHVYERLLNRPEDAQGMAYWNSVLAQNSNNLGSVALSFEHSGENFQNVVTGFYEQYLQRKPTSTELAAAVNTLASGGSQRDIEIGIINSNEYRNSPAPPASQTGTRLG